ncbi:MAG: hypothetical protein ACREHD_22640 [Pirellulales bacterium]
MHASARRCVGSRQVQGRVNYSPGTTPWCHLTADVQVVTPILGFAETSLVLGQSMKVDF